VEVVLWSAVCDFVDWGDIGVDKGKVLAFSPDVSTILSNPDGLSVSICGVDNPMLSKLGCGICGNCGICGICGIGDIWGKEGN